MSLYSILGFGLVVAILGWLVLRQARQIGELRRELSRNERTIQVLKEQRDGIITNIDDAIELHKKNRK